MSAITLALIALLAPTAAALLLGLTPALRRSGKLAGLLSVAAAAVAAGASYALLFRHFDAALDETATVTWLPAAGEGIASIGVTLDGISVCMLAVVCTVAFLVQVFSVGYMSDESPEDYGRYFTYQSLFIPSMGGLVVAPNLLQLFACWELVGLCSYLLIGYYYRKASAGQASLKAFWVTKFADMGLLLGLLFLFVVSGSFGWDAAAVSGLSSSGYATVITLLLFLGVMGKSAQFPLHIWLPNAMEGPTPVSALLHAATMVAAGVYLLVRAAPLFEVAATTGVVMTWIGAFTALFAACVATVQTDIKRVLAYSTCSQLGYMVCAVGAGAVSAGFFHLTTHAMFKALLFLAAGSMIHAVHSNDLMDMGGLAKKMKGTAAVFIIGSLALAGFPGTAGFFSKDLILEEVLHAGHTVPFGFLMVAAGLTAFYMGRVVFLAFFGARSGSAEHAHEAPASMLIPTVLLAIPALGLGYFAVTFIAATGGTGGAFHVTPVGLTASGLGLAGIALAYLWFGPARRGAPALFAPIGTFIRAGLVDRSAELIYRRGLLVLSGGVAWVDRYLIDGLMNYTAYLSQRAAQALKKVQSGQITDYVTYVAIGLLFMALAGMGGS
jgi:NADH-quinone oxidoreductase subunit L